MSESANHLSVANRNGHRPETAGREKGFYITRLSSFSSLRERSAIPENPAHVTGTGRGITYAPRGMKFICSPTVRVLLSAGGTQYRWRFTASCDSQRNVRRIKLFLFTLNESAYLEYLRQACENARRKPEERKRKRHAKQRSPAVSSRHKAPD